MMRTIWWCGTAGGGVAAARDMVWGDDGKKGASQPSSLHLILNPNLNHNPTPPFGTVAERGIKIRIKNKMKTASFRASRDCGAHFALGERAAGSGQRRVFFQHGGFHARVRELLAQMFRRAR